MVKSTNLVVWVILLSVFASPPVSGWAKEGPIVIVKSRDIEAFERARLGFEAILKSKKPAYTLITKSLEGKKDNSLVALFEEIRSEQPAMVLTIGLTSTLAARERMHEFPVLFTMVLDPERDGLAPPGVTIKLSMREKLHLLRRLLPNAARMGIVYSPNSEDVWKEALEEGRQEGFGVVAVKIESGEMLPAAFESIAPKIDLMMMVADAVLYAPKTVEALLLASMKHRVPVVGLSSSYSKAGALVSLEYDQEDSGRVAGEMALRVLEGSDPASLGYEHPSKILYTLNAEVAKRMGIHFPDDMLKGAEEVFGR